MFIAELGHPEFKRFDLTSLRTGIMAGSPCPIEVMKRCVSEMNMREVTIAYGMTETSPVSTQTSYDDPLERRVGTVGRIHPHLDVKIIDSEGCIVPTGAPSVAETQEASFYGLYTHYWTPSWRTNVQAGYVMFRSPTAQASAGPQLGNVRVFDTAANLIWSPVRNFDIGIEVDYANMHQTIQNAPVVLPAAALHSSGFLYDLRLERDF
jgi:acyl-CoA synthetase (AMP-forming)/AMP-acid ligase II